MKRKLAPSPVKAPRVLEYGLFSARCQVYNSGVAYARSLSVHASYTLRKLYKMAMIKSLFVLFCCIVDGRSPTKDFFGGWCSPLLGVTSLILTLFTALVNVWIRAKMRQHSWNKRSKRRSSQFQFVRVSRSTTPTSPSRSSRRSGHHWSKGKKTSPCILVRLGLDGTEKCDQHEASEGGKAKTMSRTSPSILVRLGLDKPKDEYLSDEGRTALTERTTVDQRIPLCGSSSFVKQSPYLWHLPTSVRNPPVTREPTGRLPPSGLLFARRATAVAFSNSSTYF